METSAAYWWRILVPLAKRIPPESPSSTKMEYKQKKFPSWGCGIAKGRHWGKQVARIFHIEPDSQGIVPSVQLKVTDT